MTGDRAIRAATAAVVGAVAGIAAVISYSHIYGLGREHGQDGAAARLLPLSVDGLIMAASLVLLHEARNGRDAPGLARVMLWLGIAATIGANIAYGARYGIAAALISAWPAVAFIGAVEMVTQLVRRTRVPRHPAPQPAAVPNPEPPFPGHSTWQAGPDPAAAPDSGTGPARVLPAGHAGLQVGSGPAHHAGRHELPGELAPAPGQQRPAPQPAFASRPGGDAAGLIAAGISIREQAERDGVQLSRRAFAARVREHGYTISNGRLSWLRAACGFPASHA